METNVATRGGSVLKSYRHTPVCKLSGLYHPGYRQQLCTAAFTTFIASLRDFPGKITLLVTINFGIQLVVDFLSARFVDKIGYKGIRRSRPCAGGCGPGGLRNPAGSAAGPFTWAC